MQSAVAFIEVESAQISKHFPAPILIPRKRLSKPLHFAAQTSDIDIINLLIVEGADKTDLDY
jgi:ankyrin repeat protein